MPSALDLRRQFRALHESGTFVMPNPHDIGTTKLLTTVGFPALATTSAGFAATLGRMDMTVARDELVEHVGRLTAATHLPFNVDSERLYGDDAAGIAECVALLAGAGAAGCSIEDWNPATNQIDPVDVAVERVAAAAEEARRHEVVLTARCENLLARRRGPGRHDRSALRVPRCGRRGCLRAGPVRGRPDHACHW